MAAFREPVVEAQKMPRPLDDVWIPLAVVGRPHGVRGELRVHPFHRDSQLLFEMEEVLVRFVDGPRKGEAHEVSIDSARGGNDAILVKLHGVDDRDTAEDTKGAEICVKRSDFPAVEDGEFYACDVLGAEVWLEGAAESRVGTVLALESYPSVDMLVIKREGELPNLEVPVVDAYVESVNIDTHRVVLRTVDGLE